MTKIESLTVRRGREQIEVSEGGGISIGGPEGVAVYRLILIKSAMELEMSTGLQMTSRRKAPSPFSIVRKEFGLKGNEEKLYRGFCEMHSFEIREEKIEAWKRRKLRKTQETK